MNMCSNDHAKQFRKISRLFHMFFFVLLKLIVFHVLIFMFDDDGDDYVHLQMLTNS